MELFPITGLATMLLKPVVVLLHLILTRLRLQARFWAQRRDRRQAAELQGMSARELNDLGIGRGEIPYLLLRQVPGTVRAAKTGNRSGW